MQRVSQLQGNAMNSGRCVPLHTLEMLKETCSINFQSYIPRSFLVILAIVQSLCSVQNTLDELLVKVKYGNLSSAFNSSKLVHTR